METRRSTQRQERRRVANACNRCRRQKIKCSGSSPCPNCSSRGCPCIFESEDKKIVVTEAFVSGLRQRILELETRLAASPARSVQTTLPDADKETDDSGLPTASGAGLQQRQQTHQIPRHGQDYGHAGVPDLAEIHSVLPDLSGSPPMVNPLASDATSYMQDNSGRLRHLGNTSTWSFNHRVLSLSHTHLSPLSPKESSLHAEGESFDLGWNGNRNDSPISVDGLPSLDFAIYLVNTVKFHICQIFHLFDEESFFANFYQFYDNPMEVATKHRLWYIHYLLIMAFGKAFVGRTNDTNPLPGRELFIRAMTFLPDAVYLCMDQALASEVLVCVALYLQSIDFRSAALVYVGQAMRVSMGHGLYTDVQARDVGEKAVHRCRRIWWTIYILDRKLSSLMGTPNGIPDECITCPLPVHTDSVTSTTVFSLHVQLAKVLGMTFSTVYGANGRLDKTFLPTTQRTLRSMARLADELTSFSVRPFGGLNRSAGHLIVTYHQAIILATRPILYIVLKERLQSANPSDASLVPVSEPANGLMEVCVDSSIQLIHVLSTLQQQSLLDSFLPFDLDGISSAGFVLAIASALCPQSITDPQWRQTVTKLLEEMSSNGNALARIRLEEINNLTVLSKLNQDVYPPREARASSIPDSSTTVCYPVTERDSLEDLVISEGFSATQILSLADTLSTAEFPEVWGYDP